MSKREFLILKERERGGEAGGQAGGRAGLQAGIFRVMLGLGKI
jgi:hypothetical protein